MQTKFSIISNIIFKYFIIFAISFVWLNFYYQNILTISLISIIIAFLVGQIIYLINSKKNKLASISLKENEKLKNCSMQLLLASKKDICIFFNIILKTNHQTTISKNNDYISWEDTIFIPYYSKQSLNLDDIIYIYKNYKNIDNIIISCIDYSDNCIEFCNQLTDTKIHILNEKDIFKLFKKYDFYPDFNIKLKQKEKFKYSQLKSIMFKKSNSKKYFFSGIMILLTSFIIRYNIYYKIFATILFIFAGISYFKPQSKESNIINEL